MDVHQTLDLQLQRQGTRLAFDRLDDLRRQAVRRYDAGRIAGVDAGFFDVLHDTADNSALAVRETVHIHLDRGVQKAIDEDRLAG